MSMDDQAAVHEAIENHRYNPEILPNLEAYVDYQVRAPGSQPRFASPLPHRSPIAAGPALTPARSPPPRAQIQNSAYDFDANLAILKLYQFYPQTTNMEVVAKILAKALMATGTDFLLCTYLISEQIKVDTVVEALYNLSGLLEQAEFKKFWETYPSCAASPLLAAIPDFEEKIGDFIIALLTRSHQSLDKSVVATLLNKTLGECEQLVTAKGWKNDEHVVYFPLDDANQAKLANTSGDKIEFSQLKTVISSLAA
eukprot:COSAG04_NODE_1840_length_5436_cov_2.534195_3_plen_255_part_00